MTPPSKASTKQGQEPISLDHSQQGTVLRDKGELAIEDVLSNREAANLLLGLEQIGDIGSVRKRGGIFAVRNPLDVSPEVAQLAVSDTICTLVEPVLATKTAFADGKLAFSIEGVSVRYEGKVTSEGKAITGNWTEGPNSEPMVLTRTISEAAWAIPETIKPMAADARPRFDLPH